MTPDRLAEIKAKHEADKRASWVNNSYMHEHRGELIAEVERLLDRQTELLAANNAELDLRRAAQLRLAVICEEADRYIRNITLSLADFGDAVAKARRNVLQSPAAKPQAPHRAETVAGSVAPTTLPVASGHCCRDWDGAALYAAAAVHAQAAGATDTKRACA